MKKMSVEWLLQELEKVNYHPTEAMIMYAKRLNKNEIIQSHIDGQKNEGFRSYEYEANKYYEENYERSGVATSTSKD